MTEDVQGEAAVVEEEGKTAYGGATEEAQVRIVE